MTKEDYIQTIYINGLKVDIGLDDYGQCYYYEYLNSKGELESLSCGTYNFEYLDYIYYELDPIYRELIKIDLFSEDGLNKEQQAQLKEYEEHIRDLYNSVRDN